MRRLLAALALAATLVGGPLLGPTSSYAKANLTTVSNITTAPVVAPVDQRGPVVRTIVPLRQESSKTSRSSTPPRVIRDVAVERQREAAAEQKRILENKKKEVASRKAVQEKKPAIKKVERVVKVSTGKSSGRNWATPGQCTWGAQIKWHGATGSYLGGFYGNALDWGWKAKNAGHSVGSTPRARSVVVLQPGVHGSSSAGHVAWVTSVSGSKITYVEMNGLAGPFNWSTRTVTHQGGMQYIYAP